MISKVLKFIEDYYLAGKTVIVGFSGGYDSMCLMDILSKIAKGKNIQVIGAHYNHNWRGEIAEQEQKKCEEFCKLRNIEFYTETAPDNIKKNETIARELRYEFFERVKNKYSGDAVFTAHNYDDNAETILYRIIKGTGIIGLKGILPKRGYFYRPLIDVTRKEIEQYCNENNLAPNNDNSNYDSVHKRNLIRHEILPMLSQINPDVKKSLNTLSDIARSEANIIDEYIGLLSRDLFDGEKIKTGKYLKLSDDVKQKIIYNLIYNSEIDYDMNLISNIVNFISETSRKNKPSKFSLSLDKWLYADRNIIEIISESRKTELVIPIKGDGTYNFEHNCFSISGYSGEFERQKDEYTALVELSGYDNLVLRTRRDGDIIKPLGFSGTMKLKKYLMSKEVPQYKRDRIVLLCRGNEVLWAAGVGLSDKIKTKGKPTHKLSIKYRDED